jgi:hypothetical protein
MFSSTNAYVASIFLPIICFLIYNNDSKLYSSSRINYLTTSFLKMTIWKSIVILIVSLTVFTIALVLYSLLAYLIFGIVILQAGNLVVFLTFKYFLNVSLFILFLVFAITLLKRKYQWLYFVSCILFSFSTIAYSSAYYTPFNWFINSLGFINRLAGNNSYRPLMDFKAELYMFPLVTLLMAVVYIKYERARNPY